MIRVLRKKLLLIFLFFLSGCTSNILESYNRSMYNINRSADEYTLKPISRVYHYITPDFVEKGVNNFFDNISDLKTFVNSLLQGKFHNALLAGARLSWNTTIGIAGIFDVASWMGIKANQEDFGQTLQFWGFPRGPYIVLPILGASTITDTLGFLTDGYLYSKYYFTNRFNYIVKGSLGSLWMINARSKLLSSEKILNSFVTDEYSFVKSIYLQKRQNLVNDGEVSNKDSDKDFDKELDDLFDN